MSKHEKFNFRTKESLLQKIDDLGIDIPFADDVSVLFDRVPVAGRTLANRFVVQPMEGADADGDGAPGELTFRRYRRYAAGGSGLIWFEATAVSADGRSNSAAAAPERKKHRRLQTAGRCDTAGGTGVGG